MMRDVCGMRHTVRYVLNAVYCMVHDVCCVVCCLLLCMMYDV